MHPVAFCGIMQGKVVWIRQHLTDALINAKGRE